jgi:predicted CoA-binding protein|tara:strand:+ start:1018 stop:1419 length:402 start_codon:yes stop_codon:yes gene_type:complete
MNSDRKIVESILKMKIIAVVGISANSQRPSNYVSDYMKKNGYKIIPVNPFHDNILNETSFPNLLNIPYPVDVVNVFRRSEFVLPIIKDAIKIKAKAIWLQDGVISEEGAELAAEAKLLFIMNDCLLRKHRKFN